jgi:hypothetical protein
MRKFVDSGGNLSDSALRGVSRSLRSRKESDALCTECAASHFARHNSLSDQFYILKLPAVSNFSACLAVVH